MMGPWSGGDFSGGDFGGSPFDGAQGERGRMDFNPNFTPPAEAFGHMESMATHMFGSDSAQVQGLKDAFSGQRSFESLDSLFGGPGPGQIPSFEGTSFGPPPAWGDAPPPGMDFSGPAPWMQGPDGWGQGMPGKGPEGSDTGSAPWMMGPPPSAWGGEGGEASGPPAWMKDFGSMSFGDFGGFEGGDAPWMGGDFSGSEVDGSEEDLELEQNNISEGTEQGTIDDDSIE